MADNNLDQFQDNIARQTAANTDQEGPGKPKRPSSSTKASDPFADIGTPKVAVATQMPEQAIRSTGNTDVSAYAPYMEGQVYSDRNIDQMRASEQGFWESTGKRVGNFIPNVAAGLIENAGYLGALVTEWGDDRDYSNALTELAKGIKNPLGDVYRENPNATWDIKDPAWWGDNFFQLLESVTEFGITGAGAGALFGNIAKLAAVGARSAKVANAIGQGLTAATLAYTEGAMSGAQVYQRSFETQMGKFMSEGMDYMEAREQANAIASNAAATTVQLNTALATALNLTSVAPMFRRNNDILTAVRAGSRQSGGIAEWGNRLRQAASAEGTALHSILNPGIRHELGHLGTEMLQEGTEEVVNQFAENTGYAQGESGKQLGFWEQFGEVGHFLDRTMDSQGALNFVLGAIGGAGNTVVMNNAPIHRIPVTGADNRVQYDDGKPVMQWVSAKTRDATGARRYFDNIVQAVQADVDTYNQKTKDLAAAIQSGNTMEAERLKYQIFDAQNYWTIMNGMGEAWQNELRDIAALDNKTTVAEQLTPQMQELMAQRTELANDPNADPGEINLLDLQIQQINDQIAQKGTQTAASERGFSNGTGDNDYVARAKEMSEEIGYLNKLWENYQAKYTAPEEVAVGYGDFLFQREADLYRRRKILDKSKANINNLESQFSQKYGEGSVAPDMLFLSQFTQFQGLAKAKSELDKQTDELSHAVNNLHVPTEAVKADKIIEKMGGSNQTLDKKAAADAILTASKQQSLELFRRMKALEESVLSMPNFVEYREKAASGKPFEEQLDGYIKRQTQQMVELNEISAAKAMYEQFNTESEVAAKDFDYYRTDKGRKQYLKEATTEQERRATAVYQQAYDESLSTERAAADDAAAEQVVEEMLRKTKKGRERVLQTLQLQEARIHRQIAAVKRDLADKMMKRSWFQKVKDELSGKDPYLTEKNQLSVLQAQLQTKMAQINQLQRMIDQASAPVAPPPPPTSPTPAPAPSPTPTEAAQSQANLVEPDQEFTPFFDPNLGEPDVEEDTSEMAEVVVAPALDAIDAEEAVIKFLTSIKTDARKGIMDKINNASNGVIMGFDQDVVGDLFAPEVANGTLTPDQAAQGVELTRNLADYMRKLFDSASEEDTAATETEQGVQAEPDIVTEEQELEEITDSLPEDTQPDEIPDSEPTNQIEESEVTHSEDLSHVGIKQLGSNSIANKGLDYREVRLEGGDYAMINASEQVREGYPTSLLLPQALKPSQVLRFEVDTNFDGTVSVDDQYSGRSEGATQTAATFSDYLDTTGNIRDIENVPIKIINQSTNEVLGYVHRMNWITAKYPGANNYRNIVDTIYDSDGTAIDNLQIQKQLLSNIRKIIVENYNAGKVTFGSVNFTGPGQIVDTKTLKNKQISYVSGNTSNRFPDQSLEVAIVTGNRVEVGRNKLTSKTVRVSNPNWTNVPGLLLPAYDGSYIFEPIRMRNLNDTDANSVVRAVELFYLNRAGKAPAAEIDKILNTTGFDVSTAPGLRQFVNQYFTYTEAFSQSKTVMNLALMRKAGTARPYFMFDIRDDGDIKVGWAFGGSKPIWGRLRGDSLDPGFVEALLQGLRERPKNVVHPNPGKGLTGINTPGNFSEVYFTKAGKWTSKSHADYNTYIKDKSTTTAVGTNQINGKYVYTINPTVQFSIEDIQESPAENEVDNNKVKPTEVVIPPTAQEEITDAERQDAINIFSDMWELPSPVNNVGVSEEATPLSLSELESLYTFTSPEQRNGKSPAQVYEELTRAGIGQLAAGYNPFIKCG